MKASVRIVLSYLAAISIVMLSVSTFAGSEPQPSPLFQKSLTESVARMDLPDPDGKNPTPRVDRGDPKSAGQLITQSGEPSCYATMGYVTCAPQNTCNGYGATCVPNATCLPGNISTCTQTCSGATCPGETCEQATCATFATCNAQPGCALCSCPGQGDLNRNGTYDIGDLLGLIGRVYMGDRPAYADPNCPHSDRADLSCDGEHTVIDIVLWVDYVWRRIPNAICIPCTHTGSN